MLFQQKTSIDGVWRTTYILCILFDVRKSILGSWILHIFIFSPLDGRHCFLLPFSPAIVTSARGRQWLVLESGTYNSILTHQLVTLVIFSRHVEHAFYNNFSAQFLPFQPIFIVKCIKNIFYNMKKNIKKYMK